MKRRNLIKGGLAAATAGTLAAPAVLTAATKKRFRWRLVMVIPKTLPIWGTGVVGFAKKVALMTDGRLKIKVYGAGELVPALGTFDAVKAGKVQMASSAAYYWQGKIPASVFFTAVPFGMNAQGMGAWIRNGGGQELWDELYAPHGVFGLAGGNTGMQMGGWFNKKINKISDFKGLKMRIPGLGGKVIERAGGKPMLVAGGEIYTNLSTGVIDATEWVGPYHDYIMGFYKAARYYYYPGWHEPGPVLELMINKKAFEELPKEFQQVVRSCAAELDRNMLVEWLAKDSEYYEKIKRETKVEILPFPPAVMADLKKFADEVKAGVAESGPLARKIYDSFTGFQARFEAQQAITERAYMKSEHA